MVAVLFAHEQSNYKNFDECDVWDIKRNALNYCGNDSVIAHPPCRAWSQLRHFAKPRPGEKDLAIWAIKTVRRCGGVLEHPNKSSLWPVAKLPEPGQVDEFGGWTLVVSQHWWGHLAEKMTRLYIVGCKQNDVPAIPIRLGEATHVQTYSHKCRRRPQMPHKLREHTPPAFAKWLVDLAAKCSSDGDV